MKKISILLALLLSACLPVDETIPEYVEVVATGLNIPWDLRFLPTGDILVTERSGNLLLIGEDKTKLELVNVKHIGEGGLLGLALHPNFEENHWIYLYLTTTVETGLINRVERYRFVNNELTERREIISGIPGARFHDGGRIEFGPDNYLYITTGDATNKNLAQDLDSFAGKILRITDNGEIPKGNPFGTEVYSFGHRNSQGITWDEQNQLWSTEHGRSGLLSGYDELNLIQKGKNYGWPVIQGGEVLNGMETPLLHSGPDFTWAPASAQYVDGSIFFGGLKGEALYEVKIENPSNLIVHLHKKFGRIRTVRLGPDGYIYFTTSNTDGRGKPDPNDDKILRVNPSDLR